MKPYSVLFVCTANIVRSPMAATIFKAKVAQKYDLGLWVIESAGTWAREYATTSLYAYEVMKEMKLDLSRHRSRNINRALIQNFNLVLVMEQNHKEALRVEFPDLSGRIYLLSEMIGKKQDIRDPYRGTRDDYFETAYELDQMLTDGFERICQLAKAEGNQEEGQKEDLKGDLREDLS
jgi:protein-tyrosine-phosphatase